ncbi:MAG: hypothetical protein ACLFTR_04685 [Candidatus Woesearchaeota archaeon]
MVDLVSDYDDIGKMVDFFVRDEFMNVAEDTALEEFFISYFKDKIFYKAVHSSNLYLSDDEKTLEYAGRNTIEPIAEYFLITNNAEAVWQKKDYAEKGAIFSIVHPVIANEEGNGRYFMDCASALYGFASNFSENKEMEFFYGFLSGHVSDMSAGLDNILRNISEDGLKTIKNLYDETVSRYEVSEDGEEKERLAESIAKLSYKAGVEKDDVPLERKHYHYLFEV